MRTDFQLHLLLALGSAAAQPSSTAGYDYVIVGGGTAGLVVANRLSEDPNARVVIVEAGDDARNYPGVMTFDSTEFNASIDWQYNSLPQKNVADRSILYHAGKAIGGTSNINGMIYTRGEKVQLDAFEILGNAGWTWDTLFPYFQRTENFTTPTEDQISSGASYKPEYHGSEGYLKTGFPYNLANESFHTLVQESAQALGVPFNLDLNGGSLRGFGSFPRTIDRDAKIRETSARAYYTSSESRPNLKVIKGTVTRITWSDKKGKTATATGVEYLDGAGKKTTLKAAKEVIVAAGTYKTPLILELSGVGNPRLLSKHKIATKVDLPGVGEGLQDASMVPLVYSVDVASRGQTPFAVFATAEDLYGKETASLSRTSAKNIPRWAKAVSSSLNNGISAASLEKRFKIQHEIIFDRKATVAEVLWLTEDSVVAVDMIPFSWGNVHLQSPKDINKPALDPKMHAVDFDTDILIRAGRLAQSLFGTKPFSDIVLSQVSPDTASLPARASDAQWKSIIAHTTETAWHGVGTCAMVPRELGGVVDSNLKIYGTTNVRVVDASVIPVQISGHMMAALYAIAERASDIIKAST
ncbi:hypothetical protein KVR01_006257 [Diaporthe batatas]|uniref:uncharacterized protein n=1 Tax=Diaporthe batatas TaxID=748121 RepID=UPI001D04FB78|nr:uncharacterized protein KVR01_006257 [Diaporthe batatas]KAG8164339.1 hypothetical protein KVR01_006257 [Diaporthe batatas]